jgi:hypothetical protein
VRRPTSIRPPGRVARGRSPSSRNCEVRSTDAGSAGGLARSVRRAAQRTSW